jgi:hypothetical protein
MPDHINPYWRRVAALLIAFMRRYTSEHTPALGAAPRRVHVATHSALGALRREARADIASLTRARQVEIGRDVSPTLETVTTDRLLSVGIAVDNVSGGW